MVFAGLLCIAVASVVTIVSSEGVDGLIKRKRDALNQVMPEAVPVLDRIEKDLPKDKLPMKPPRRL
jgi:hypothetical protein